AFVALHGTYGEDGTVQEMLEECGILYTGSGPVASEKAFDKAMAKEEFVKAGIPTPRYAVVVSGNGEMKPASWMKLPVVVKPSRQGSTIGVSIVKESSEWAPACEKAAR